METFEYFFLCDYRPNVTELQYEETYRLKADYRGPEAMMNN